jgi:hypothetical protein
VPHVKPVEPNLPIEPVLARERTIAAATGREQATVSPALELRDLLEVALTRPQTRSCHPGRVAALSVVGISVVSACLAFWVAVASALSG